MTYKATEVPPIALTIASMNIRNKLHGNQGISMEKINLGKLRTVKRWLTTSYPFRLQSMENAGLSFINDSVYSMYLV